MSALCVRADDGTLIHMNLWVEHEGRWHRVTDARGRSILTMQGVDVRCGARVDFAWHTYLVDDDAGDLATPAYGRICETCSPVPSELRL